MDNSEKSGGASSSKQIWQLDVDYEPNSSASFMNNDDFGAESSWQSSSMFDPFSQGMVDRNAAATSASHSHSSFFVGGVSFAEEEEEVVPANIETIMNQAIADQAGSLNFHTYSQLIYQNVEEEDDGVGGENDIDIDADQGDEAAMMEMDADLGPQEDPKLFKDLPNYNQEASARRRKRVRNRKGIKRAYPALPPHIGEMMQNANMMYIEGNNAQAMEILREVIKERADAHEAWLTLGMIYNSEGNVHKMIQCNMMAAHLSTSNNDLWKSLAYSSKELGYVDQAIYCFKKAHKVNSNDIDSLFEMSDLLSNQGMTREAGTGLEKVLLASPLHVEAIKSLARIYLQKNELHSAIGLFERLVNADLLDPLPPIEEEEEDDDDATGFNEDNEEGPRLIYPQRMGYEELNMMSELCMETLQTQKALDLLHVGICKLQGCDPQTVSYLSRTSYDEQLSNVPIELRVKIGLCCLDIDNAYAADIHLRKLFDYPQSVEVYPELFLDVGDMYMKKNQTQLALKVFKCLSENSELEGNLEIQRKVAECYLKLGDHQNALRTYEDVLLAAPNDVELQNQIVLILEEMGEDRKAARMQRKFLLDREREAALESSASSSRPFSPDDADANELSTNLNLFSLKPSGPKASSRKADELREKKKAEISRVIDENKNNLERLQILIQQIDRKSIKTEYIIQGKKLLQNFSKVDRLRVKNRAEDGISGLKRIIAYEIGSGFDVPTELDEKYDILLQGISYRDWLNLVIEYSILASNDCRYDDAYDALKAGLECHTIYSDPRRRLELQLCLIAAAFNNGESELVGQVVRGYCFTGPYMITGLKLYCAAMIGSTRSIQAFCISYNQKFMHRQMEKTRKMLDDDPNSLPGHAVAVLFASYGHVLFCAKSYGMAIDKYLYARTFLPKDPVINFSLGIAFLHKATLKTESRHSNIIKGFAFLLKYRQLKGKSAETEYNLARAFHQFQLFHLAIPFYESVLADPKGRSFSREASYNLSNIYVFVGSPHLSKRLLKKHWTLRIPSRKKQ